jgi:hypothetical protein
MSLSEGCLRARSSSSLLLSPLLSPLPRFFPLLLRSFLCRFLSLLPRFLSRSFSRLLFSFSLCFLPLGLAPPLEDFEGLRLRSSPAPSLSELLLEPPLLLPEGLGEPSTSRRLFLCAAPPSAGRASSAPAATSAASSSAFLRFCSRGGGQGLRGAQGDRPGGTGLRARPSPCAAP